MKSMKSMKKIITLRFGIILIVLSIMTGFSMLSFRLTRETIKMVNYNNSLKESLINAKTAHYAWSLDLQESIFTGKEFTKTLDPTACDLGKQIYSTTHTDETTIKLMKTLEPIHKTIHETASSVLQLSKTDKASAINIYNNQIRTNINSLIGNIDTAIENKTIEITNLETKLAKTISFSRKLIVTIGILILIIIIRTFFYVKNKVADPTLEIINKCGDLAKGNLSINFTNDCNNEIGLLGDSLQESVNELKYYIDDISEIMKDMSNKNFNINIEKNYRGDFKGIQTSISSFLNTMSLVLREINYSSEEVASGVEQISNVSHILANGSAEQSGSIQELNNTLQEFSLSITETVSTIENINVFVENTGQEVINGNKKMNEMTEAMNDISSTSDEIIKIIKTIDDIAEQTNTLAINAAVEAARAGSTGKGFAVVAEEVRNLAQRSAQAAKDTTKLIQDSVKSIENGVEIANETASMLVNIVNLSNEIGHKVSEVSTISQEQLGKVKQIVEGVEQISNVVQLNASTSEESATASESLSNQSSKLNNLVSKFNYKKQIDLDIND